MQPYLSAASLPDPMHPKPWEEKDEPLASDRHYDTQDYIRDALRLILEPLGHYVTRDRWLRMDPNDHDDRLLPDLLVALDVPAERRDPDEYAPWVVGKPPDVLGELLSPSSKRADLEEKPKRYAEFGVREYFLFDVDGRFGQPLVQGWRLSRDGSRTSLPVDDEGSVASEVLPIRFVARDGAVAVEDARTGHVAPRFGAVHAALQQEAAARLAVEEARARAEAEVQRLRAEVERLRREGSPG